MLGLTGTIGSGKSTTADLFRDCSIPVWDADATVHELYDTLGEGTDAIRDILPSAIVNGVVDRSVLRDHIKAHPNFLATIETVIHPIVQKRRKKFLETHANAPLVVCDIPLLFETGADKEMDAVLVVSADHKILRDRVLSRPEMTIEIFESIIAKQMPDDEKRKRADFLIDTGLGMDHARQAVHDIVKKIRGDHA